MLPRRLRLKRPQDFQSVRRRGGRLRDTLFTLHTLPNELAHNRFGFVVSKQLGNAVIRNTLKRRLRAATRYWLPYLTGSYDVVLVAHAPSGQATYQELEQAVGVAFRRARLLVALGEEMQK